MKPLVTIACITYNQEKYIAQAIEGFLMQKTNFPFEIIVHDDASTDRTREIVDQYAKDNPQLFIKYYEKENQYSKNTLAFIDEMFKMASGKYIAICEGDDYWTDPNKLQLQVDFMESHPSYGLCFHPMREFFENHERGDTIWPLRTEKSKLDLRELLDENFIPTNAVMYRKQTYDDMPVNVMPKDWYNHLYHAQFGKIGYIDRVMSAYRRHDKGMWWEAFNDQNALWRRHGLSMMSLHSEVLKMYGDSDQYRKIIGKNARDGFIKLLNLDEDNHGKLAETALHEFPELAKVSFIHQLDLQKELVNTIAEKELEKDRLVQEILELRTSSFLLRDELHAIKNSRVLGRIIKSREIVGETRKTIQSLPRRTLHKIRVIVAPFFPSPVRKGIKRRYKAVKGTLNSSHDAAPKVLNIVDNKRWRKGEPLVSVVVPYYNRADTIDDTLRSLKAQTLQNFETILVDDGSPDEESIKKLDQLVTNKADIRIIRQENQGVATARNNGIAAAKGKYIVCLDSDDMLEETFLEKCTVVLETTPDTALVTTHQDMFGVMKTVHKNSPYQPLKLIKDNMVITAAEFRKEAWEVSGGYKSGIGYEDWEYWINLSEHGFWGKLIPEELFKYRTSVQSRYVDDKDVHWSNLKVIRALHPNYRKNVKKIQDSRSSTKNVVNPQTAFINLNDTKAFSQPRSHSPNVLITIPWMTFGGAETLIYNYCREIKDNFNITFVTGLLSNHEWEYKFKEITPFIYHLANLLEDEALYVEFISNYIETRNVDILHIIHNGFMFKMLPKLRERHPKLKVVVTMFNDRVEYFEQSIGVQKHIDAFTTDNQAVAKHYAKELEEGKSITVIPNGINCYEEFNPTLFDRVTERQALGLKDDDLAIFFVGRLSVEKNPDVFIGAAEQVLVTRNTKNVKFFVVGDGPMRPSVEKLLNDINSDSIVYLGYQSEVARFLSAADVFVLPSSIEGFPLSILEAMAMRVVVVASNVGAIPDVINSGDDGFVVTPGSVSEIAEALSKLKADPELLESMKNKSREKVEVNYSNRALGKNYKQAYRKLSS